MMRRFDNDNDNAPAIVANSGAAAAPTARAYYNEIDPFAAQWLRNLIANGHIAPGDVDERSIVDVRPADLAGYTQCHFFAGIGVWSAALRASSWPDTRRVWTASCPCQPFSAAGKGGGFDDERHLWPALQWLIQQCRPDVVFGEQVASKDGLGWLDLVSTDLEAMGYACGAVPSPAAGIGAPHIRQRLYWVADAAYQRHERSRSAWGRRPGFENDGEASIMAQSDSRQLAGQSIVRGAFRDGQDARRAQSGGESQPHCADGLLDNAANARHHDSRQHGCGSPLRTARPVESGASGVAMATPTTLARQVRHHTFWSDADWIYCRDDKYRPVEPGTFPLAHGLARGMATLGAELRGLAEMAGLHGKSLAGAKKHRIGSLKGYGNAIVKQHGQAFIESYCEAIAGMNQPSFATTNKDTAIAA